MNILVVLLLSLLIAIARGGRISELGQLRFQHIWLLFLPLALQLVIFTPLGSLIGSGDMLERNVYIGSMGIAALALVLNRHIPGMTWVGAGLALNFLVILLNGGAMPVWPAAREFAGMSPLAGRANNVVPFSSETVLPWLGDVIPLPSWMPLANVMSIGDLFVLLGGIIFTQRALFRAPTDSH